MFIAPAGTNDKESLASLGGRWVKFMANSQPYGKELDPTGEMMKAGMKNFFDSPVKTGKEVVALSKKGSIYKGLGRTGLKPFIFVYSADDMYPHRVIGSAIGENGESLRGYAVPVSGESVGAGSFEEFKSKSGLSGKEAKKAWAHHYRNASHNDLLLNPKRTVNSVLQILNHELPDHP